MMLAFMQVYMLGGLAMIALILTPAGVRLFKLEQMTPREVSFLLWTMALLWPPIAVVLSVFLLMLTVGAVVFTLKRMMGAV